MPTAYRPAPIRSRGSFSFRVSRSVIALFLAALPLVLSTPAPVAAQSSGEGRLMGQVLSAETGGPLPGAQIQVSDAGRGVMAGVEGRYQIDRIPVGETSLRVSMLGFAPQTVEGVVVEEGGTTRIDIHLARQALEMEGLVATAQQQQGSRIALRDEQRNSSSLVNAISSEQIARSPDGDAAAAMRRVSGVTVQDSRYVFVRGLGERYTTSSLNGSRIPSPDPERKMVPLDLFPAGLLQSISTNKTFTPDNSGDFSGGSVDIRTPDFPVRRTFTLSVGTGYHPELTGRSVLAAPTEGQEWLALGAESREIPAPARNFSGTVTRGPEVNEVVNSFRNAWSVEEETAALPSSLSASMGGSTSLNGSTIGYLGSATYSRSQDVKLDQRRARTGTGGSEIDRYDGDEGSRSVLLGGLAKVSALVGTHSEIHFTNNFNRSAENQARREVGVDENTQSTVQVDRLSYVERAVRSHQLDGRHQLGPQHVLDWSLSASGVSRSEPDRSEFVTWLDPETPIWFKDFEGAVRTFGLLEEDAMEAGAGYAFVLGGDPAAPNRIRTGITYREHSREAWSEAFRLQPFHWSPNDPRWQLPPEQFFDGRHAGEGDDHFILSRELSGGTYGAADRLQAGYLMAEVNVTEGIRLTGGARLESYRLDLEAQNQLGRSFDIRKDYTDLLPSLSARVRMGDGHQLRLSATQTLARPEYREVAPIAYREVLGGEQVIGNADLERTLIQNLDARWEWYPRPGEVISLGVFGKWFDDPIEQRFLARSGTNTRTFVNAESATNHGIELEIDQRLDRVHPALSPFSFFTNVTLMRSRVQTGQEGDEERAMVGQAPFVVNSGLSYVDEAAGISATLLHNVVGKRIMNARASGSQVNDVVEQPRNLIDFSVRFPLMMGAAGKVDVKNLLDAPYEVVQGPITREYHRVGRSVSVGLSWRW